MPSLTTIATQTLLLSSFAAAIPSRGVPVGTLRQLLRRQEGWEGSDDGNVFIRVSDNRVNWGQGRVDGGMLDWVKDECSDISCGTDGQESETDTHIVKNLGKYPHTIKLKADGKFVTNDEGTKDHMFELADVALKEFEDVHDAKYAGWKGCVSTDCEKQAENDINEDNGPLKEGWYPEEVHITVEDSDGGIRAFLDLTLSVDSEDWSGFCGELTSIGSTLGGAVSAVGGTIFSLAGLFCAD